MSDFTKEDYEALLDKIHGYYNDNNADVFQKVGDNSQSPCDINQLAAAVGANVTITRDLNNNVIGYDYQYRQPNQPDSTAMSVNSNSDEGLYGVGRGGRVDFFPSGYRVPGTINKIPGESAVMYSGAMRENLQQQLERADTIVSFLSPAWAAVSGIAKLGKVVSERVYETAPDFFDNFFPLANPETWPYLAHTEAGEAGIRALFDIDDNGNTTMYMDEDTLGYIAMKARDAGVFDSGEIDIVSYDPSTAGALNNDASLYIPMVLYTYQEVEIYDTGYRRYHTEVTNNTSTVYMVIWNGTSGTTLATPFLVSESSFTARKGQQIGTTGNISWSARAVSSRIVNGVTYYYSYNGEYYTGSYVSGKTANIPGTPAANSNTYDDLIKVIYYGVQEGGSTVPGVSDQPGATIPVDAITGADPHAIAQNLVNNYPQIMGDPVQIVVMDDSCNEVTKNYYSVPFSYSPTTVVNNMPITGGLQVNPSFNPDIPISVDLPDVDDSQLLNQIILQLMGSGTGDTTVVNPDTGEPELVEGEIPNTGEGVTPPEVLPEAQVTAMWHIYNPSSSELTSFGSWMWEQTIIDQIIRLFNNPMEAVIGLHAVFVEPHVSSPNPIVVGNIASRVSSNIVTKQYKSLNCGSVWLTEYFGNVFDYAPFTKVKLYLPFVGIVDLNVADVMRGEITVQYMVDVYTGACTATVSVNRDGVGGVLYQYSGNCAVEYPVSGASYSRMWQALASTVAVGLGGFASGNIAGAAGSMVATAMSAKVDVAHSGSFSGNPGAMGIKKPYLIITRPQTNMAIDFERYDGRGSNYTSRVGDCSGYIKCKEVHLNVPGAYKDELDEIEELLKEGILI